MSVKGPDELYWCYPCRAWRPWNHREYQAPAWRVRLRRAVGRLLKKAGRHLTGERWAPELPPPDGYEMAPSSYTRCVRSE